MCQAGEIVRLKMALFQCAARQGTGRSGRGNEELAALEIAGNKRVYVYRVKSFGVPNETRNVRGGDAILERGCN
jgi:hypothetical protein